MGKMTLIDVIIDQYERSAKWNNDILGNTSLRIEEKHYKDLGKNQLINGAKELEEKELLKIKWVKGYHNIDIEKLEYPLVNLTHFYQLANRIPKYEIVKQQLNMVHSYYNRIKSTWIRNYIELEVLPRLEKGNYETDHEKMVLILQCLSGLDQLVTPMLKRIFSKRFLKNSKVFEKQLQAMIVRLARKYSDEIEDTMEDSDVLSQLYIEEYSQELYVKGSIRIEVEGNTIDTGNFPYGTVLNTQTIKNSIILDNPQIIKILTIENKANFIAEPFQEGTLIIFSHGYFTPLERVFLKRLKDKLSEQRVEYLHSGDMDFGGVRIFGYIKNRIFPEVQPFRMDLETFRRYLVYAEPIEESALEKLKKCNEPLLQVVINQIIDTGLVIEQEAYL